MPSQSPERVNRLEALAKTRFGREFTEAEQNLLANAPLGHFAYCGPSRDPKDSRNSPSRAEPGQGNPGWGAEREIAAELIHWLCADKNAREEVDRLGIRIQAAKISGDLDLSFLTLSFPIHLQNCAFSRNARLRQLEIPSLDLEGSWVKSITSDGAITKGDVSLGDGFHADGEVSLYGTQIGGDLDCDGGTFHNPGGLALNIEVATVKGHAFLRNGFHADGEVKLLDARSVAIWNATAASSASLTATPSALTTPTSKVVFSSEINFTLRAK